MNANYETRYVEFPSHQLLPYSYAQIIRQSVL
jgi:hypothetical protein